MEVICFAGCNISNFSSELPNLVNGSYMFFSSNRFLNFSVDLPNLKYGTGMFTVAKFTSFSQDITSLINGTFMFERCFNLINFTSKTPNLEQAMMMFAESNKLTRFDGNLQSLINGNAMFRRCRLDLMSVQNIADTINDLSSKGKSGNITIGMSAGIKDLQETSEALEKIRGKGWTVIEQYN